MTTKTTTRTVDVVSKEEWKALVKAQELNRTQLLRSGMGTGTGTGTGTEESSQFFTLHQDKHGELFSHEDVTWDINASVLCVVEVKNGQIVSVDSSFSYSFTGGTGIGDYGQYHNVMLQGNTFMGSTSGVYSNYSEQIQDDYYDFYNSVCNPTWNWIFYRRKYCRRRGKSYKFFILECYNGYSLSMRSHI